MTGAETRLALSRPGVRKLLLPAWVAGGLGWSAVVEAPSAVAGAGGPQGALVPAMVAVAVLLAALAGRTAGGRPGSGLVAAAGPLFLAGVAPRPLILAVGLIVAALAGGWVVGGGAGQAARSAGARAHAAGAGLVVASAAGGFLLLPFSALWLGVLALLAVGIHAGATEAVARPDPTGFSESSRLSARGLFHAFGDLTVLDGLDLDLRAGEMVALVGGNGSGKSTLLRALGGHLVPDAGEIRLEGRPVVGAPPEELGRAGVCHVSGARPVFADLTVEENLRVGAWLAAGDRRAAVTQATEVFAELGPLMKQPAGTLSGGEQRLVALAQSLLVRPSVLLVDEVTLGLSPQLRRRALEILRAVADAGAAVLVVDHELEDLAPLADRVLRLDSGRAAEGPADSGPARFITLEDL